MGSLGFYKAIEFVKEDRTMVPALVIAEDRLVTNINASGGSNRAKEKDRKKKTIQFYDKKLQYFKQNKPAEEIFNFAKNQNLFIRGNVHSKIRKADFNNNRYRYSYCIMEFGLTPSTQYWRPLDTIEQFVSFLNNRIRNCNANLNNYTGKDYTGISSAQFILIIQQFEPRIFQVYNITGGEDLGPILTFNYESSSFEGEKMKCVGFGSRFSTGPAERFVERYFGRYTSKDEVEERVSWIFSEVASNDINIRPNYNRNEPRDRFLFIGEEFTGYILFPLATNLAQSFTPIGEPNDLI